MKLNQQINRIVKYLYHNIDGAISYRTEPNKSIVTFLMYFQDDPSTVNQSDFNLNEIKIEIDVTTYNNKVRVDMIELDPNQRTLGYYLYSPESIQDMKYIRNDILNKLSKRIRKFYGQFLYLY